MNGQSFEEWASGGKKWEERSKEARLSALRRRRRKQAAIAAAKKRPWDGVRRVYRKPKKELNWLAGWILGMWMTSKKAPTLEEILILGAALSMK